MGSNVMIDQGLYGDRLAKIFPMIQRPHPGIIQSLQKGTFAAARLAYSGPDGGPTLPPPPDDAFALCLRLRHQRAEVWAGRTSRTQGRVGGRGPASTICSARPSSISRTHSISFIWYMPRSALAKLAEEQGAVMLTTTSRPGRAFSIPLWHIWVPACCRRWSSSIRQARSSSVTSRWRFIRTFCGHSPWLRGRSAAAWHRGA